jgi:hypothetical protein
MNFDHHKTRVVIMISFAVAVLIILIYRHKTAVSIPSPDGQVVSQAPATAPQSNNYLTYNIPPLSSANLPLAQALNLPSVQPSTFNITSPVGSTSSGGGCGCGCGNSDTGLVSSPMVTFTAPSISSLLSNLNSSSLVQNGYGPSPVGV